MPRPVLEVADVLRRHGDSFRARNADHLDRSALRVMGAIETCRTAALGGHVERCNDCGHTVISYNSCRNRHCPKCQAGAAREWLEARAADLLPVEYFHIVFTCRRRSRQSRFRTRPPFMRFCSKRHRKP